jgi:hypothetical protein
VARGKEREWAWTLRARIAGDEVWYSVDGSGGSGPLPFADIGWKKLGHLGTMGSSSGSRTPNHFDGAVSKQAATVEVHLATGAVVPARIIDTGDPRASLFIAFWSGAEWAKWSGATPEARSWRRSSPRRCDRHDGSALVGNRRRCGPWTLELGPRIRDLRPRQDDEGGGPLDLTLDDDGRRRVDDLAVGPALDPRAGRLGSGARHGGAQGHRQPNQQPQSAHGPPRLTGGRAARQSP